MHLKQCHPAGRRSLVLAVSILLWTAASWCQVDTGVITGVVRDANSAVVPDAQVTISNTATNYV